MNRFTATSSRAQLLLTAKTFACLDAGVIAAMSLTECRSSSASSTFDVDMDHLFELRARDALSDQDLVHGVGPVGTEQMEILP